MIDTHTHIFAEEFVDDVPLVIERAQKEGVKAILLPNEDEQSLEALAKMCDDYVGYCFPLYGLHPTEVRDNYQQQLNEIFAFAEAKANMIGVGEIGLDLYWDDSNKEQQIKAFEWQIDYSINHQLPMSIHCRNAYGLLFDILSEFNSNKIYGSLHCFSGSAEDAEKAVNKYPHLMFGINGSFTYKKSAMPQIFQSIIPTSRIVLETDAPYLSPVPKRGQRNEPANLSLLLPFVAKNYGVTMAEMENITEQNATKLFRIPLEKG